ncbi:alkaline phosphatase family protein [Marivirga salinae]|uniref:Alkaline phosphatase family protein n=1 Tax=Marivirga salinarum TaxID=3059078 RepID=A0AA51RCJ0_9BACT|nr:alkaline phosphatase PafA [Marivirga sp. BDSF4-3]WMN11778.1 alkaline phosphatase family protein [Marivirga sp. BDSF4-3]
MMRYFSGALALLILFSCQAVQKKEEKVKKPKLVVGIVIDQLRHDYFERYADNFGEDGFKRLISDGFYNHNTHYNYIPTFTGPGHASVYTGTTPATHGIIANNWYDKNIRTSVYCAEDTSVYTIGSTSEAGLMSPHRMLSSTITDELGLATNFKSKVIGISIKDRGSILPAGHNPTGSFWYDKSNGHFVSSSYYGKKRLPTWLQDFNNRNLADDYLNQTWELSMPLADYTESTADDMPYEMMVRGKKKPIFPYNLKALRAENGNFSLLPNTAYGNTILADLAIATLEGEEMGKDDVTDFLALSFSSTDYIGHGFGPRSVEVQDTYIKLDQEIARLFKHLDEKVGKGNYLIFVTSDHGCAEVPEYLQANKIPADHYDGKAYVKNMSNALNQKFGEGEWIEDFSNEQFFLNHDLITEMNIELDAIRKFMVNEALKLEGVAEAYSATDMQSTQFTQHKAAALQMGYNFKRSGDVLLILEPGWFYQTRSATTHGTGYAYDTHVPLIWYGSGIKSGTSYKRQNIDDIAVTLAHILGTSLPNGATGEPIQEILE